MSAAIRDGILVKIWIVHVPKIARVVVLVLLYIGEINPPQRVHKHVVQGGRDVPYERHQEERYLEDIFLDEIETSHDLVVPRCLVEAKDKRQKVYERFDT